MNQVRVTDEYNQEVIIYAFASEHSHRTEADLVQMAKQIAAEDNIVRAGRMDTLQYKVLHPDA